MTTSDITGAFHAEHYDRRSRLVLGATVSLAALVVAGTVALVTPQADAAPAPTASAAHAH